MGRSDDIDRATRGPVALLLRAGLVTGVLLMAIGLVLAIVEGRLASHPVALGDVPRLLLDGRPTGFMAAGIALLVAAPLARVVALAVGFAIEGDRRFALVAVSVALILGLGVLLGSV